MWFHIYMNRNAMIGVAIVVVMLIAVGGFVLLGKKSTNNSLNPLGKQPSPTQIQLHSAVGDVTVTGTDFAFNPRSVPVVAGKSFTLTLKTMARCRTTSLLKN